PVWVKTPGSVEEDWAIGLSIDNSANLYLIGGMLANISFPTQPAPTTFTVGSTPDTFIAKYDQNGQVQWAKQIDGTMGVEGVNVAADALGQIYLTGLFQGAATFDSLTLSDPGGSTNGFLVKYNTAGNAVWARKFGRPGGAFGERVSLDAIGNPHVSGILLGQTQFGSETPSLAQ